MSVTVVTRLTVIRPTGLPPKSHRPGSWRSGGLTTVRRIVTAAALERATAAFFASPSDVSWDALMVAQDTAEKAR